LTAAVATAAITAAAAAEGTAVMYPSADWQLLQNARLASRSE